MELTHELAGLLISLVGLVCIALARPIPRQVQRLHIHAIDMIEPAITTWLVRAIGLTLVLLGLVTAANPA